MENDASVPTSVKKLHKCRICGEIFKFPSQLSRHRKMAKTKGDFKCEHCCVVCLTSASYSLHIRKYHMNKMAFSTNNRKLVIGRVLCNKRKLKKRNKKPTERPAADGNAKAGGNFATDGYAKEGESVATEGNENAEKCENVAFDKKFAVDNKIVIVNEISQDPFILSPSASFVTSVPLLSQAKSARDNYPNANVIEYVEQVQSYDSTEQLNSILEFVIDNSENVESDPEMFIASVTSPSDLQQAPFTTEAQLPIIKVQPEDFETMDSSTGNQGIDATNVQFCNAQPDDICLHPIHGHSTETSHSSKQIAFFQNDDMNNVATEFSFVAKVWKLTRERGKVLSLFLNGDEELGQELWDIVYRFLKGYEQKANVYTMVYVIVNAEIEKVGRFIIGMLLFEYLRSLSMKDLIYFYNQINRMPDYTRLLVHNITLLLLQGHVNNAIDQQDTIATIPFKLLKQLNLEIHTLTATTNVGFDFKKLGLLTTLETSSMFEICNNLQSMIMHDQLVYSTFLYDQSYFIIDRTNTWTRMLHLYIHYMGEGRFMSPFSSVLYSEIDSLLDTVSYGKVFCDMKKVDFLLHEEIGNRLGLSPCDPQMTVLLNKEEFDGLRHLLYMEYRTVDKKPKITKNICIMLIEMGVVDVIKFLSQAPFNAIPERIQDDDKLDFFHSILLIQHNVWIKRIVLDFENWFPFCNGTKCLNGVAPDGVRHFLNQPFLPLDELTIYKILIQWAHDETGITCNDELDMKYNKQVDENFQLVRSVIRLPALQEYAKIICRQNYVKFSDFAALNAYTAQQSKFWFSIKERE